MQRTTDSEQKTEHQNQNHTLMVNERPEQGFMHLGTRSAKSVTHLQRFKRIRNSLLAALNLY